MRKDWSLAGKFILQEDLKKYTTFRIGGPCPVILFPSCPQEVIAGIRMAKEEGLSYLILGAGSNLLVKDEGYSGVVIQLGRQFGQVRVEANHIFAEAGAMMSLVANKALEASLTGLEFASGIPGTVGGCVTMNAGAYGGEMKDVVTRVQILDAHLNIRYMDAEQLEFSYRKSKIQRENWVVLGVEYTLKSGNSEEIKHWMDDYNKRRREKQPLEYPSAGSTFKRPKGYFAGKLIEDAGLRGFRYKDAMVSDKHCGFVINAGNASFEEVITLIHMVQKIVYDQFGVMLEREVKIIGEK